ncbi:MAG: hypothetical protein QM727_07280 [Niabella sp.]
MARALIYVCLALWLTSCKQIEVTEEVVFIPKQEWHANYEPAVVFQVADSGVHDAVLLLRIRERYAFNNLVLQMTVKDTATHRQITSQMLNVPLTNTQKEWAGHSIGDTYDYRVGLPPLTLPKGIYRISFRQQMQEDPLYYVMNIGMGLKPQTDKQ